MSVRLNLAASSERDRPFDEAIVNDVLRANGLEPHHEPPARRVEGGLFAGWIGLDHVPGRTLTDFLAAIAQLRDLPHLACLDGGTVWFVPRTLPGGPLRSDLATVASSEALLDALWTAAGALGIPADPRPEGAAFEGLARQIVAGNPLAPGEAPGAWVEAREVWLWLVQGAQRAVRHKTVLWIA